MIGSSVNPDVEKSFDVRLNYGDLSSDEAFVSKCENLKKSLSDLNEMLQQCKLAREHYNDMSDLDKVDLDLCMAFTLTSLQWVAVRLNGEDPNDHPLKQELVRIQSTMVRVKELKQSQMRPKVNKAAAKRFIRSGLWDPNNVEQPANKKIKFDVD